MCVPAHVLTRGELGPGACLTVITLFPGSLGDTCMKHERYTMYHRLLHHN